MSVRSAIGRLSAANWDSILLPSIRLLSRPAFMMASPLSFVGTSRMSTVMSHSALVLSKKG
jgi:hypothetical protein